MDDIQCLLTIEAIKRLKARYFYYHETYEKLDSGWRIKSTRLARLYVERS